MKMVVVGQEQSNVIHFYSEIYLFWLQLILFFINFKGIVDIFDLLSLRAIKQMGQFSLKGHEFKNKYRNFNNGKTLLLVYYFLTLVYKNVERKMKNRKHSKVSHSKNFAGIE